MTYVIAGTTVTVPPVEPPPVVTPPPPPPVAETRIGLRSWITTWEGFQWDTSDYTSGVFLTAESVVAFGMPPVERRVTSAATEPGSRYRGHRVAERPGVLPLFVYSDAGSVDWVERDSAFWRGMRPGETFTLSVQAAGQSVRHLTLRFDGDDAGYSADPTVRGWAAYAVEVVAEDPFWRGDPVVRTWTPVAPQPFFGGNGGGGFGPPFYISSSSTLAGATIDNPGDVEGYTVWQVDAVGGDVSTVTVGVGDRLITAPFVIPDGVSLTIDPRPGPRGKSAYDSTGARRTAELSARDFAAIPPGRSVPLSLNMTGSGRVTATLVPGFYRAWG